MAEEEKKRYPNMSTRAWWGLRKKFRNSIPKEVTPTYVATVLQINAESAQNNILPSLRLANIIDKEGKTTERARLWRDDISYPNVCEQIRQEIYPQELLDLAPDATADKASIQRWFANHTGVGDNAAGKYASFYFLLLDANPAKENEAQVSNGIQKGSKDSIKTKVQRKPPAPKKVSALALGTNSSETTELNSTKPELHLPKKLTPSIHLDIQIHISPETSAEQIDKIFESMAKHLKDM